MNIAGIKVNIAGIKINIVVDNEDKQLRNLGRYSQFIIRDKNNTSRPDVKIELKKSSFFNFNLDDKDIVVDNKYWSLYNKNGYKIFRLKASKQGSGIFAKFDGSFRKGVIYSISDINQWIKSRLEKIILINLTSLKKRVIFHACGVIDNKAGYIFLGESGFGKSTLASLWHRKGGLVIHDDQVIIYKRGSDFVISGLPWQGRFDHPLPFKSAKLKKIFFIKHGLKNNLSKMKPLQSFDFMTKALFLPGWDKKAMSKIVSTCFELAQSINCYQFAFLPTVDCIDFLRKEVNKDYGKKKK